MANLIITIAALIFIGTLLILAELLVIPGFGIAGIGGILSFVGAGYLSFTRLGYGWGLLTSFLSVAIILMSVRYLVRSGTTRELILRKEVKSSGGYRAPGEELESLRGKEGIAISRLRPSGLAEIEGRRVDVITDGEFVEKGAKIRVKTVVGNRVLVEEVAQGEGGEPDTGSGDLLSQA